MKRKRKTCTDPIGPVGPTKQARKSTRGVSPVCKQVISFQVSANWGWKLSSKSEGVKSPSKSENLRGFPDFRGSLVFAVSQIARQRDDLRSILGRKGNKKGNSSELPEMRWWSSDDFCKHPSFLARTHEILKNHLNPRLKNCFYGSIFYQDVTPWGYKQP